MRKATIRLESSCLRSTDRQRFRFKSDGKVKTSLNVLAKGKPIYGDGGVKEIKSEVDLFNMLTERFVAKSWVYTQHVLPVRNVERFTTIAPAIPESITATIGHFLTALLAFKGKTLEVVSRELKLCKQRGEKALTYNINTKVTWGEVTFNVNKVTVKKTHKDGIFFCGDTCRTVKAMLSGATLTKDGQIDNIG